MLADSPEVSWSTASLAATSWNCQSKENGGGAPRREEHVDDCPAYHEPRHNPQDHVPGGTVKKCRGKMQPEDITHIGIGGPDPHHKTPAFLREPISHDGDRARPAGSLNKAPRDPSQKSRGRSRSPLPRNRSHP